MVLVKKMEKSRGKKPIFRKVAGSSPKSGRSVARVLNEKKRLRGLKKSLMAQMRACLTPNLHIRRFAIAPFLTLWQDAACVLKKEAQTPFFFLLFLFFLTLNFTGHPNRYFYLNRYASVGPTVGFKSAPKRVHPWGALRSL